MNPPLKIAIITTIYKYLSHAQHIGDRFLVGYPHKGNKRESSKTFLNVVTTLRRSHKSSSHHHPPWDVA